LKQVQAVSTGKGKVPVHALKVYKRNRGMAPLIPNLGTKWRWAVNFTLRPGKKPESRHPLHESVGEVQSWCGTLY